ncbi:MAG: DUF6062 family protein [Lachnospiraceae bacterium]|nr:DUF6062 family protein [Lachnospiraceae bacterium]
MAEKIYTIPVNEAFESNSECPFCFMKRKLERDAINFTMGPSYMEDDVRAVTDKTGFCGEHLLKMYKEKNRLGLALMLESHMRKTIQRYEKKALAYKPKAAGLFGKKSDDDAFPNEIMDLKNDCYICKRMEESYTRYISTFFYLLNEREFQQKLENCNGFCLEHYAMLLKEAKKELPQKKLDEFVPLITRLTFDNLKRVDEDLDWFIKKFDYRFQEEPWKNSKDAVPRSITKLEGETPEQ